MHISLKYKIIEKIIQTNDEMLLNEIKYLMNLSECDFWIDLPAGVKHNINNAKAELDRGESIPHSEVMKEIRSRFLNI